MPAALRAARSSNAPRIDHRGGPEHSDPIGHVDRIERIGRIEHIGHLAWSALRGLAEVMLPAICAGCRAPTDETEPLCPLCARTVDAITNGCPRCGLPLPIGPTAAVTCLGCQKDPSAWTCARAPFAFAGELASAIRRYKHVPDPSLARPLAQLLAPSLSLASSCDAFVPVPLHPNRLRAREFNQASVLARMARAERKDRSLPPVWEALDRTRDTPPQSRLDAAARRANMKHAFTIAPRHANRIRGATLCLVDDVLTTGATASACARTLLSAGAIRVDVLTLARTLA